MSDMRLSCRDVTNRHLIFNPGSCWLLHDKLKHIGHSYKPVVRLKATLYYGKHPKLHSNDGTIVTSLIPRTFFIFILTLVIVSTIAAQQPKSQASPSPSPSPTPVESDQEAVRVFTEEVRLPVLALDAYGHYDPT